MFHVEHNRFPRLGGTKANLEPGALFHVEQIAIFTANSLVPRETTCIVPIPLLNFRPARVCLARIIAIANQKGGVGKTTTAVNLAACLATAEQPTLLVDCDSQANATAAIGFPKDPSRRTLYHALILNEPFEKIVQKSQVDSLDVVPADKNLAGAAVELVAAESREYRLQAFLESIQDRYKFIILDCPPALDLLTLNGLVAANAVLVPIQCEYLALEGVSELLDTLMRIRRTLNPKLEIEGILLTMYDERTTLSRQVATDLRSFFGSQIFQSVIPRNVRLAEAPSFGKPIIFYDIHSKGAEGYTQLAQEVIANAEKRAGTGARSAHSGA
jgi:chromosome partitioning protein